MTWLIVAALLANTVRVAIPDQVDSPVVLSIGDVQDAKYPVLCATNCAVQLRAKDANAAVAWFRIGILIVRPTGTVLLQPRVLQPVRKELQKSVLTTTVSLERLLGSHGAALVWLYVGEVRFANGEKWGANDDAVREQLMKIPTP